MFIDHDVHVILDSHVLHLNVGTAREMQCSVNIYLIIQLMEKISISCYNKCSQTFTEIAGYAYYNNMIKSTGLFVRPITNCELWTYRLNKHEFKASILTQHVDTYTIFKPNCEFENYSKMPSKKCYINHCIDPRVYRVGWYLEYI